MSGSGGMVNRRKSSTLQGKNLHLLGMEYFSLLNTFCNGSGDQRHGEKHCSKLLVKSKGELVNEGDILNDSCFGGKILEVGDILLESVIYDSIRMFE